LRDWVKSGLATPILLWVGFEEGTNVRLGGIRIPNMISMKRKQNKSDSEKAPEYSVQRDEITPQLNKRLENGDTW